MSKEALDAAVGSGGHTFKTPAQGAATSVVLATYPGLDGHGGHYFEDCDQALPAAPDLFGGVAPHALDPEAATRLWTLSADLTGSE
jgi:hypothetical protein